MAPPPKRTRLAEKPRAGTCALADRIARCAIDAYAAQRASCGVDVAEFPVRTVLAAFILRDDARDSLRVLSLGVGTKTLGRYACTTGRALVDCHAEVLARRGLKKFLLRDARAALRCGDANDGDVVVRTREGDVKVKDGLSLHLYVSSAPCGNACVRRWAKGRSTKRRDELGTASAPSEPHETLSRSATDAGQVALCVKVIKASKDEDVPEVLRDMVTRGELAAGTAPARGDGDEALTCSDKLCVWNVVGYQGALLRRFMREPLYVETITIGRKFSEPHLCRAMCCRVDGFRSSCGGFATTHPALMETAVVFDDVPMDVEEGAVFENPFAMIWCDGDDAAEALNGKTGTFLHEDASAPSTSKAALYELYLSLLGEDVGDSPTFTLEAYARAKREADEKYDAAKTELFEHPKMFEPRRGFDGWHEKKSKRWSGYKRTASRN
jgi:hypothetical protein|tara:strand:+ start:2389 stop:3708 length:1320 start_codon:yes stop_codon:yes gene_type:complete